MGAAADTLCAALLLAVCLHVQGFRRPDVYSVRVFAEVRNRYAKTLMTTRVANPARRAQEITFDAVLPDKAFISGFVIEMDGKAYHAYVKGKEEARREYHEAVAQGRGAAHVAVSARDSNVVQVSVNVEAQTKVTFNLTYEQLLEREAGAYHLRINLNPGQVVRDLSVEVQVEELAPLRLVQVPRMRSGNELTDEPDDTMDPLARIERPTLSSAIVRWSSTEEEQRQRGAEGVSGQLVVRYDVDRDASPSQILVSEDGYFVHFYAPPGLPPLPKHVIFVLDVSGSMHGRKLEQLKTAMHTILDELNESDTFSLIPFASEVKVWQPDEPLIFTYLREERLNRESIKNGVVSATRENIAKAKRSVDSFEAIGVTYMYEALETALLVSKAALLSERRSNAPMVVLLTDGEPNGGISNTDEIVRLVTERNRETAAALFTLAFGSGADYGFLRRLALRNGGIGKKIYEAGDAHLQLRNFYRQIASPLLAGVTFKYDYDKVDEESVTTASFKSLYRGGELVVAGRLFDDGRSPGAVGPWYRVDSSSGNASVAEASVAAAPSAERLWAYLRVRQLLDQNAASPDQAVREEAKRIALQYSFVTEVTSLVVVKPNETSISDLELPPVSPGVAYTPGTFQADDGRVTLWAGPLNFDHSSVPLHSAPKWLQAVSIVVAVLIVFVFN
ncbi:inter-alpha-trypsin inhibitor heavy chain H4-like [Schistocerca piceifrons]|uniref:inter-alpha-trypsin inhibitor heavy chain H4-like n=1 Tax=Schistocerca piceifrons TaxID=274613 RepID=UPI001F5FA8A7|nr:inter-alpha-trypsin inhibitor heavy chain H4-like [Schistocerca piceifrons]